MTTLVVSANAQNDIDQILDYLVREAGVATTARYAERFRQSIALLVDFPRSGAPRPSLGSSARIAIVYPYVVIYDYDTIDNAVIVLRIVHGKRNITRRLIKGPQ